MPDQQRERTFYRALRGKDSELRYCQDVAAQGLDEFDFAGTPINDVLVPFDRRTC